MCQGVVLPPSWLAAWNSFWKKKSSAFFYTSKSAFTSKRAKMEAAAAPQPPLRQQSRPKKRRAAAPLSADEAAAFVLSRAAANGWERVNLKGKELDGRVGTSVLTILCNQKHQLMTAVWSTGPI
jgi:hypothetical protein